MSVTSRFTGYCRCQLVQINPALNRRRIYFLEICQGLFHVVLFRAWGRIGYRVRCKEEWYPKIEDAIKEANRLYREKTRKGYRETTLK
ncbi:MAG: WGR domain-containing protein [Desulfuromonadaceae bacterium]|nr:WGR domain-containing protein [Desulfuromonadaceae bacterium]